MDFELPLWLYYVIGFPLLLGPLVTVHELGHYLVGRWFGVQAEAFSIGFGKELWGFTDKRGTRWKLAALPLGGYVQFKGDMNPASIPDAAAIAAATADERNGSFHHAALWKRALIVFAGPATNILATLLIFTAFFLAYGKPVPADAAEQLTIAEFAEHSPARDAGLQRGDRITAVNGQQVEGFRDLVTVVAIYPDTTLSVTYLRDGQAITVPIRTTSETESDAHGNVSRIGRIGIRPVSEQLRYDFEPQGLGQSLALAVGGMRQITDLMVVGISQIVEGKRSVSELGGPIKIGKLAGEQLSRGPLVFVEFAALISLNLAFINLLPIPALDGGHLAFYAAEAVRRKPVGPRGQEVAYRAGVALVLMLMIFVTINDLAGLPIFGK